MGLVSVISMKRKILVIFLHAAIFFLLVAEESRIMQQDFYYNSQGRKVDSSSTSSTSFYPLKIIDKKMILQTPKMGKNISESEFDYQVLSRKDWYRVKTVYKDKDVTFYEDTKRIDQNGYEVFFNEKFELHSVPGDDVFIFRALRKGIEPEVNEIGMANILWTDRRLDKWSIVDKDMVWSKYMRHVLSEAEPNGFEWPLYNTVKNVSADSELEETIQGEVVKYRAKNVAINFYQNEVCEKKFIQLNPWVEGVQGSGINQSLHIEFWDDFDNIVILNGYVDLLNSKLYKENNRVKDLLITGKNDNGSVVFEQTITFNDVPSFQKFSLPRKVRFVDLTIKSVYKGTKYDDTCIRSVFAWPNR